MKFQPIINPTDDAQRIDVHEDPPGLWGRVVVVCGWQPAKIARRRWPDAAAVGPLRTVEGIDLLVRSLLANPQIRRVVLDTPRTGPIGERAFAALRELWEGGPWTVLGEDVQLAMAGSDDPADGVALFSDVRLIDWSTWLSDGDHDRPCLLPPMAYPRSGFALDDEDRPGGRIVLPPPPPMATASAPHGDPGQRIAGRTLADVWPRALEVAMRFGRKVPTHYGATREYLGLVSVIRDPLATINELRGGDDGKAQAQGAVDGEEARPLLDDPRGARDPADRGSQQALVLGLTYAEVEAYYRESFTAAIAPEGGGDHYGPRLRGFRDDAGRPHVDQFEAIDRLLDKAPNTRAAFLAPWRPDSDAGIESGRPCLVGLGFRALPFAGRAEGLRRVLDGETDAQPPSHELHAWAQFRSHDLWKGYPLNLAALCLLLRDTAARHGMAVGTLTVTSFSAHVYDRSWNDAEKVIATNPGLVVDWDPRSIALVEARDAIRVTFRANLGGDPPEAGPVIGVIEGKTATEVALKIKRSGLATEPGHLLWIGIELARAEAKL